MEKLANAIYEKLLDMDFMDYDGTLENDMGNLLHDLKLLEKQGSGALLSAIKMLIDE